MYNVGIMQVVMKIWSKRSQVWPSMVEMIESVP